MPAAGEQLTGFRPLEHAADKAIEAWGPTLEDLFAAAADGMFSESVSRDLVTETQEWAIEVEADRLEDLLHAWLSELLWVSERDEAAVCRIEMELVRRGPPSADEGGSVAKPPWRARGRAWGGPTPADLPHTGAPVKAVTYHNLRVWQREDLWRARVVFDV